MRGRLGFLLGLGAGYVLGAKAGRERYEQLQRLYDNLILSPTVRQASDRARGAVGTGIEQAKEGVAKVTGKKDEEAAESAVAPPE